MNIMKINRLCSCLLLMMSSIATYAANDAKLDAQTQQKVVDRVKEYCNLMQEFSADVEKIDNMDKIYAMCENNNVSVFNDLAASNTKNIGDNSMPLQQYMMIVTDKFENNVKTSYSGFKYLKAVVQPSPMEGFDAATYAFVKVDKQVNATGVNAKHHLNIIVNTETMKVSSTTSDDFEDPQSIYLKALEKYNDKRFDAAIPLFEKVSGIQRFPGRYRAKSMLGWIYLEQDNYQLANDILREAAEEDPLGKVLLASNVLLSDQVPVTLRNTTEGIRILQALGEVHDKEIPQMHLIAKAALADSYLDFKTFNPKLILPKTELKKLANDLITDLQSTELFQVKGYILNVACDNDYKNKEALKDLEKAEKLLKRSTLSRNAQKQLAAQIVISEYVILDILDKEAAKKTLEKAKDNPYALPAIAGLKMRKKEIDGAEILDLYRKAAEYGDPFSTYIVSISHFPFNLLGYNKTWGGTFLTALPARVFKGWPAFTGYLLEQQGNVGEFLKWNQKAIDLGNTNAMDFRAFYEVWNMKPFENVDYILALERECKAAVVSKTIPTLFLSVYSGARHREKIDELKISIEKSRMCQTLKSLDEQGNGAASYLLFFEYYKRNNEEMALHYLERSRDAGFYYGIYDYANYMIDVANYDQAFELYNKLTVYPQSGAYYRLGLLEQKKQNYKEAHRYYEIGIREEGDYECYEGRSDLYKEGLGCAKDLRAAYNYIDSAVVAYQLKHGHSGTKTQALIKLMDKQKELEALLSGKKPSTPSKPQQTPPSARTNNQATSAQSSDAIQMPQFPNGTTALVNYLSENIRYPKDAEKQGIQGRVVVSFVVDTDGSIKEVEVVQKVYPSLDAEASRLVKNMPKWKPATKQGVPVRVRYKLPISFALP